MKAKTFGEWVKGQNAGLWVGVLYLAYSIFFFVLSFGLKYQSAFGPGPGLYPRWLSGISIVVAVAYIIQSITRNKFFVADCFPPFKEIINVFLIFASCMVFMLLLNTLGFNIAGSLLLFTVFVRQYKIWQAIVLSILITVICYVIFVVCFSVPLPQNILGF